MEVKIDTKEKFHVVNLAEPVFTATIASSLTDLVTKFLQDQIKNVVLNLSKVDTLENQEAAQQLVQLQQTFYENNASFVVCNLSATIEERLEKMELLDMMNITPTESEAWDIVQMEEIERELLDDEE